MTQHTAAVTSRQRDVAKKHVVSIFRLQTPSQILSVGMVIWCFFFFFCLVEIFRHKRRQVNTFSRRTGREATIKWIGYQEHGAFLKHLKQV